MNICPGCESEIKEGAQLCDKCLGEGLADALDDVVGEKVDGPFASLELEDGQRFEIDRDEVLLGRSDPIDQIQPDVDLSICGGFEQGVSRRHAIILWDENGYMLEDLGSTNGTVVNREKVKPGSPVTLSEGDVIHLGKMKAVFHAGTSEGGVS
ncbi:MAG: FHA domain-containing protein [Pseudomonadota bacterium]|jgi:pSer/pThr/pTyr-binding forkhead associated (FHA) protein